MGDLSAHFSKKEFRCHCGLCGLDTPAPELLTALEALRMALGKPIRILSGLRCKERNAKLGGAKDSQHLVGRAADIMVADLPLSDLARMAAGVPEFYQGGIGIYPDGGFIHADTRGERARWGHLAGRYCSYTDAWSALRARESVA